MNNANAMQAFMQQHSGESILNRWILEKDIEDFLHLQVTGGVILADALLNDGLRDQISPELLAGFKNLMQDKADTADKIRDIIVDKLLQGDAATQGLINKIKGQIGENVFLETAQASGMDARLADLGNQEAWDVATSGKDGIINYVQVKTTEDASSVIESMQTVSEKIAAGQIMDGSNIVHTIQFAVPSTIYDKVIPTADALNLKVLPLDISPLEAAAVVQQGIDNMAYWGLGNFFNQLAGGTLTAATIHILVQMYLMHKGAAQAETAIDKIIAETGYSTAGIGSALIVESFLSKGLGMATGSLPAVTILVATGMTTRGLLRRILARHDHIRFVAQENHYLTEKMRPLLLNAPV